MGTNSLFVLLGLYVKCLRYQSRMGGREVEGTGLEKRC